MDDISKYRDFPSSLPSVPPQTCLRGFLAFKREVWKERTNFYEF